MRPSTSTSYEFYGATLRDDREATEGNGVGVLTHAIEAAKAGFREGLLLITHTHTPGVLFYYNTGQTHITNK